MDEDVNGDVTYVLMNGLAKKHFILNPKTGYIVTKTRLDRETQSEYYLSVLAKDGGTPSLMDHLDVNVRVGDINDNQPIFLDKAVTIRLLPDTPIGAIHQLQVSYITQ